jgi:ABC-type glycerol-3-phosphate transport system substrate-binding protein
MGILVLLGVGGVVAFSIAKRGDNEAAPRVVMWGTLENTQVTALIADISKDKKNTFNVGYVQKNSETFENDLIQALARGQGPDMVLLPQDLILKQRDKFYLTPYNNYSERTFRDGFIEEGELYLDQNGIIGFPFSIDPMVMYWNRDLFTDEDVAVPPASWVEFITLAPKLTKRDETGNIIQSLVAFGEVRNVTNAKDVISMLLLQAGTTVVSRDSQNGYVSTLDMRSSTLVPAEEAVSFFTEFSNPVKPSYSWNRALLNDRSAFVAGKLAVYFGFASEVAAIRNANPNLNFDVAMVPQTEGNQTKRTTFGKMKAIAILKSSRNLASAFNATMVLTDSISQDKWIKYSGYAPVRRDLLTKLPGEAYKATFYRSALISRGWLDPNREETADVFARMIENVTSGKRRISESVNSADVEISSLLKRI